MSSSRALEADRLFRESYESLRLGQSRDAVTAARKAARLLDDRTMGSLNLAAVLIDAGSELGNGPYLREGVALLHSVETGITDDLTTAFHYNLGNGYASIGSRQRGYGAGTKPALAQAISHLDAALELEPRSDIQANLAGTLLQQGRWIEAYDEFDRVVRADPLHHSALARRGSCLIGIYNWTPNHSALLTGALADHEKAVALSYEEPVFQRSYRSVIGDLRRRGVLPRVPDVVAAAPDHRWIWQNRLALNPCPLCEVESPDAFDLYPLAQRLEGGRRTPPIEDLHDMVNAVCQAFAVARWLLYRATEAGAEEEDHVISVPGSAGAVHDLQLGLTMASVTGFYGVLGKIAYAVNAYFNLGHPPGFVTFQSIWRPTGGGRGAIPSRRSDLHPKLVRTPTPALSALYRLALSTEHGLGRYQSLRTLRNQIEHHLVVGVEGEKTSPYFRAIRPSQLRRDALRLGQIVKAAIWYFGGTLLRGEQERLKRALRRGTPVGRGQGESVIRS